MNERLQVGDVFRCKRIDGWHWASRSKKDAEGWTGYMADVTRVTPARRFSFCRGYRPDGSEVKAEYRTVPHGLDGEEWVVVAAQMEGGWRVTFARRRDQEITGHFYQSGYFMEEYLIPEEEIEFVRRLPRPDRKCCSHCGSEL